MSNPITVIAEVTRHALNEDGTTTETGGHTIVAETPEGGSGR